MLALKSILPNLVKFKIAIFKLWLHLVYFLPRPQEPHCSASLANKERYKMRAALNKGPSFSELID